MVESVRAWFVALQQCVNAVDYERTARELFAVDAVAFGTKARLVEGLAALREEQWSKVWPTIREFRFDLESLRTGEAGDMAWAVTTWSSTGFDDQQRPFERPGRATVIFRKQDGRWLAIHSHFSLAPG